MAGYTCILSQIYLFGQVELWAILLLESPSWTSFSVYILPLTLSEVEKYLQKQSITLDRKQIVQLYMVMGGVAKYLSYVQRGKSATQIIDELCFTPQGPLLLEFSNLYQSLFDSAESHVALVKMLASKRQGLLRPTLLDSVGLTSGGQSTHILDELEESGFVLSFQKFGQQKKEKMIRLIDEYSSFYLNFIDPVKSQIIYNADNQYWAKLSSLTQWQAWAGYAFEMICLKHIKQIKRALGISAVNTTQQQWFYRPERSEDIGTQIDLLIDRADGCINIFEIKFCDYEYSITKDYAKKVELKKQIFKTQTNTKKTIFLTMLTPYGVKQNEHYFQVVDNQLTFEDLFVD